jgi:hypothetical protein
VADHKVSDQFAAFNAIASPPATVPSGPLRLPQSLSIGANPGQRLGESPDVFLCKGGRQRRATSIPYICKRPVDTPVPGRPRGVPSLHQVGRSVKGVPRHGVGRRRLTVACAQVAVAECQEWKTLAAYACSRSRCSTRRRSNGHPARGNGRCGLVTRDEQKVVRCFNAGEFHENDSCPWRVHAGRRDLWPEPLTYAGVSGCVAVRRFGG